MKIQLVNSPFDFDEVGEKTAQRWARQQKADFMPDGKLRIHDSFSRSVQAQAREYEQYERAVDAERGGHLAGEWLPKQCGPRMSGAPEFKTQQFIPTIRGSR